jgi:catechol 2,3-dioxygenase-like lactoylglutathione lyase family enzyme
MEVEQVDFVSVPTRDYGRAVAWYRDVLGLPVSEYTEAEVETPNLTLSFWLPEEQGEQFVPNENGIALRVADVHAAVEEVRAAGADVMGIEDSGVCHMGFVKDPDGNVLILHRRYGPKAPLRGADHQDVRAQTAGRAKPTRPPGGAAESAP